MEISMLSGGDVCDRENLIFDNSGPLSQKSAGHMQNRKT